MIQEMREYSPVTLRYYRQETGGPAAARNLGIRNAEAELILFSDDDKIATPTLLREHLEYHQSDEEIAVLGRTEIHPEVEPSPFIQYLEKSGLQFGFHMIKDSNDVPYRFFVTSNVSLKRTSLLKVGFCDEEFKYPGYEDTELGYRLFRSGVKILYNPNALNYHLHAVSLESFSQAQYRLGKSAVVFQKKHPELPIAFPVSITTLFVLRCKWFCRWLLAKTTKEQKFQQSMWALHLRYFYLLGMREARREIVEQYRG